MSRRRKAQHYRHKRRHLFSPSFTWNKVGEPDVVRAWEWRTVMPRGEFDYIETWGSGFGAREHTYYVTFNFHGHGDVVNRIEGRETLPDNWAFV